jgi:predicted nucleic acid-binding protein
MTIFDTDTVTHFSHNNENVRRRIDAMEEGEELAVTLITRMEILQGRFASILKAADETRLRLAIQRFLAAEAMLDAFLLAPADDPAAQNFERLRTDKKLRKMRRPDMLIACVALAHKALLVTRNTKDFKHVPGLRVENWVD